MFVQRICAVWSSESSLCANFNQSDNEDSGQTVWMCSLIWVFIAAHLSSWNSYQSYQGKYFRIAEPEVRLIKVPFYTLWFIYHSWSTCQSSVVLQMIQRTTKPTLRPVWPAKTQISLFIHQERQRFSSIPLWIPQMLQKAHAISEEDSDQTVRISRLI